MIGIGASILYTINMSRGNREYANKIFTTAIVLNAVLSIIYVLIGVTMSGKIMSIMGARGDVYEMGVIYLKILLLFSPVFMFNDMFTSFIRNDGYPRLSMIAMIVGSVLNIVLDYIFIFPLNLGILGAVFATGVSPIISILIAIWLMKSGRGNFKAMRCRINFDDVKSIIMGGASSLITELSNGVVMILINFLILKIAGDVGVAGYGVIANISLVVISIYSGIECGLQSLVSRGYGKKDKKMIYKCLKYAIVSVLSVSIVIYSILNIWADPITSVFNSEGNRLLQEIAVNGMRIYFIGSIFARINIIVSIYHSSIRMPKYGQISSLLRGFFLIIPISIVLSSLFGMNGIWMTFPVTEILTVILSVYLYSKSKKKIYETL